MGGQEWAGWGHLDIRIIMHAKHLEAIDSFYISCCTGTG
jgi:hypothetical protein